MCILDLALPDIDGLDVCRRLRQYNPILPVLMLTARSRECDKVAGLDAGADDYLAKPFGVSELLARVRALFRRSDLTQPTHAEPTFSTNYGHRTLLVDAEKRTCTRSDQRIELTPKEFDLLMLLVANPGRTYSRKELLRLVWGYTYEGYEHTVTAHINRLRSKIEPDFAPPVYILTSWGIGYRFTDPDPRAARSQ